MKSQLAEVQTGFEPLFFHIQADFQWQRPFSEGCGGWISEKSKKNLSQSYGRWIVGFHEPMTSAFLRSKRALRLEVYLSLAGYDVTIEPDGSAGLRAALTGEFDLLLLDLMLPGVDGFTICRQVREQKKAPHSDGVRPHGRRG